MSKPHRETKLSAELLTPEAVRACILDLVEMFKEPDQDMSPEQRDFEVVGYMEWLWHDVLAAIAEGNCTDPKGCASAALKFEVILER